MQVLQRFFRSRLLSYSILFAGILLRLKLYLENRSFWLDEAWLAIDISVRSIWEILGRIMLAPDMPVVPMGFAVVEYVIIRLWENHEYALRLFPLICGLGSLMLFYILIRIWLKPSSRFWPLVLFSFSGCLIVYASELKQYSTDLLVALGLYWLYARSRDNSPSMRDFLLWCSAGFWAVFFSYPSIFILAALGLMKMIRFVREKDWEGFRQQGIIGVFWVFSFAFFHWSVMSSMTSDPAMVSRAVEQDFFPAWPLFPLETLAWLGRAVKGFIGNFLGLQPLWASLSLFMIGGGVLFRQNRNRFFVLVAPMVFLLVAALMHRYPFGHRFVIFAVPSVFVLMAVAIEAGVQNSRRLIRVVSYVVAGLVAVGSLRAGAFTLLDKYSHGEYRTVIRHLGERVQPGDALFLNQSATFFYGYYYMYDAPKIRSSAVTILDDRVSCDEGLRYVLFKLARNIHPHPRIIIFVKPFGDTLILDEKTLEVFGNNPRTWLLLAHYRPDMKDYTLSLADQAGKKVQEFKRKDAELYLYDFSH